MSTWSGKLLIDAGALTAYSFKPVTIFVTNINPPTDTDGDPGSDYYYCDRQVFTSDANGVVTFSVDTTNAIIGTSAEALIFLGDVSWDSSVDKMIQASGSRYWTPSTGTNVVGNENTADILTNSTVNFGDHTHPAGKQGVDGTFNTTYDYTVFSPPLAGRITFPLNGLVPQYFAVVKASSTVWDIIFPVTIHGADSNGHAADCLGASSIGYAGGGYFSGTGVSTATLAPDPDYITAITATAGVPTCPVPSSAIIGTVINPTPIIVSGAPPAPHPYTNWNIFAFNSIYVQILDCTTPPPSAGDGVDVFSHRIGYWLAYISGTGHDLLLDRAWNYDIAADAVGITIDTTNCGSPQMAINPHTGQLSILYSKLDMTPLPQIWRRVSHDWGLTWDSPAGAYLTGASGMAHAKELWNRRNGERIVIKNATGTITANLYDPLDAVIGSPVAIATGADDASIGLTWIDDIGAFDVAISVSGVGKRYRSYNDGRDWVGPF